VRAKTGWLVIGSGFVYRSNDRV